MILMLALMSSAVAEPYTLDICWISNEALPRARRMFSGPFRFQRCKQQEDVSGRHCCVKVVCTNIFVDKGFSGIYNFI